VRRANETRLDRLIAARHERDAAVVKQTVSQFVNGLTPAELFTFDASGETSRERLWAFLADQPSTTLATIERWSVRKGGK